jgi:hypothetical protein
VDCFIAPLSVQLPSIAIHRRRSRRLFIHQRLSVRFRPSSPFHPLTSVHHYSSPSPHRIPQIVCCVRTLQLVLYIVTKFWGMGQHHVLGWWKHYHSIITKVLATKYHIIIWANFFEFTIFTIVWSSIYSATII